MENELTNWNGRWNLFDNKWDKTPKPRSGSFKDFYADIQHSDNPNKKNGVNFSPVTFKPDTTRGNENVEQVHLLVYDFDGCSDFDKQILNGLPHFYIACSSWQDRIESARFRLIFPLHKPYPAELHKNVWKGGIAYLRQHLPADVTNCIDTTCKNASRFYYTKRAQNPESDRDPWEH
jgi:hypothetical protein